MRMIDILKENTGLDTRTIKSKLLCPTDVWLTADELIELGVADSFLE
jgi:ATP-dependent protease ClpP protease subunit